MDVSIWLVQFVKAMRDNNTGEMQQGAHIIGLFTRLCRLMYYRMRPVIVFDGPPPMLKKRTIQQRQWQRLKNQALMRSVAERILLNQMKLRTIR